METVLLKRSNEIILAPLSAGGAISDRFTAV